MSFRRPSFYFVCLLGILSSVLTLAQTRANPFTGQLQRVGDAEGLPEQAMQQLMSLPNPQARQHARRSRNVRPRTSAAASTPVFANAVTYDSGGPGASFIAVADVNGDGKPDLLVANAAATGNNGVGVLLGNGDGTFQLAAAYGSGGQQAEQLAVGDINNDGALDIVVANSQTVGVLLGNGDGTFQTATVFAPGSQQITALALADVNRDGKLDLIVGNRCTNNCGLNDTVGVMLGNGDGTFQSMVSYALGSSVVGPNSIAVADVNNDGKPDLVISSNCATAPVCTPAGYGGAVSVLLGKGDGTFQAAAVYASGDENATSLAVGDVNGDGKPDIVVSNFCVDTLDYCYPAADSVGVLLGKGDGTFQNSVTYNAGGLSASSVAIADLDGDGAPDIIVANECGPSLNSCSNDSLVGVLAGNGDGTFQPFVTYDSGGNTAAWLVVTDVNGDGRPDLLVANACATSACTGNGVISVFLNTSISFGLVPNPATVNISIPGQSESATIAIFANGNLNPQSLTNWSCSGLPKGSSCAFGTIGTNNQISLTIKTTAAADLRWPRFGSHKGLFYASLLLGLFGMVGIKQRERCLRSLPLLILVAILALAALWVACGGGSSSGGGGGGGGGGGSATSAGIYTVTVSATSGSLKPSTTITLNVQ